MVVSSVGPSQIMLDFASPSGPNFGPSFGPSGTPPDVGTTSGEGSQQLGSLEMVFVGEILREGSDRHSPVCADLSVALIQGGEPPKNFSDPTEVSPGPQGFSRRSQRFTQQSWPKMGRSRPCWIRFPSWGLISCQRGVRR